MIQSPALTGVRNARPVDGNISSAHAGIVTVASASRVLTGGRFTNDAVRAKARCQMASSFGPVYCIRRISGGNTSLEFKLALSHTKLFLV